VPRYCDVLAALGLEFDETAVNDLGRIHLFTDHEGVEWHVKDYPLPDPNLVVQAGSSPPAGGGVASELR